MIFCCCKRLNKDRHRRGDKSTLISGFSVPTEVGLHIRKKSGMQLKPKHKVVSTCSSSGLRNLNLIGLGLLYNFTSWFKHDRSNLYHDLRV